MTLCDAVVDVVTPNQGLALAESVSTSGGNGLLQDVQTVCPPFHVKQAGAIPAVSTTARAPVPLRSAGCCRSRIALGLTGFGVPATGGVKPRENPRPSHSLVTRFQFPPTSLYSTRK